jgi:hypothetical protein
MGMMPIGENDVAPRWGALDFSGLIFKSQGDALGYDVTRRWRVVNHISVRQISGDGTSAGGAG